VPEGDGEPPKVVAAPAEEHLRGIEAVRRVPLRDVPVDRHPDGISEDRHGSVDAVRPRGREQTELQEPHAEQHHPRHVEETEAIEAA